MKRIITICITILVIIGIITYIFFNISTEKEQKVENQIEIKPEAEIMEQEDANSEIKLYFADSTSKILVPVIKKVQAKELINDPYTYVLKTLFEGTKDNKYKSVIPSGCKINKVDFEKGILYIDLSKEFENAKGSDSIYAIVNTMTQFNEINKIKFTIEGKEKKEFENCYSLKQ